MMTLNSWPFCFRNAGIKARITTPSKARPFCRSFSERELKSFVSLTNGSCSLASFLCLLLGRAGARDPFLQVCAATLTSSLWVWCPSEDSATVLLRRHPSLGLHTDWAHGGRLSCQECSLFSTPVLSLPIHQDGLLSPSTLCWSA